MTLVTHVAKAGHPVSTLADKRHHLDVAQLMVSDQRVRVHVPGLSTAPTTEASQAALLASYMSALRSLPASHRFPLLSPWTFSAGSCFPLHALPLFFRWAMFPLTLPFVPVSTWRLPSSFFHAFPKSLPSPSPLLHFP